MQNLVEFIALDSTQAMFYTFAIRVADKEMLGNPGDFARKLGITVTSSRSEGFDFYLDGYVAGVLTIMAKAEFKEKRTRKVEQKTVSYTIYYYSQNETAINREHDKVRKKLYALKEEYEKGLRTFSFTIGGVYPFKR